MHFKGDACDALFLLFMFGVYHPIVSFTVGVAIGCGLGYWRGSR